MSNIPVPDPLELDGDVEESVKQFKLQWKYYALATELSKKAANIQKATLMAVIGKKAAVEIDEMTLTEAQSASPEAILEALEEHLIPKKDVRLERAEFNTISQQEGEKIEDFVKRMRKQAKKCGYNANQQEEMIKDRLIIGILDHAMRKKLLKAGDLTVDNMVAKVKENQEIEDLASKYEKMSTKPSSSQEATEAYKVTATKKLKKTVPLLWKRA